MTPQTAQKIKQVKVSELIPYINNARTHSDKQITMIASSIKEFGFNNPILCDGNRGVIAGHGRLLAANKLGMDKVPVIELAHLTENQKRAYILADNKLAELSGWDEEMLMKPIELVVNAVLNSTEKDMLVIDYFFGSGSTLIACEKTGRRCFGMEISPKYVDVAVKRWEDFTGKKAVKAE
jgi:hypothetical protein